MRNNTKAPSLARKGRLTDAKLLLIITICVFVVMYLCAVLFLGSGFKKPQTFFNILNENAALLILSCGMSLVMITGGIDISVGTLTALVCMSCAVNLDFLLIHHCMDSPVHILTILHIQNNIRLLRVCFHFHAVQLQNTFLLLLRLRLLLRGFLLKKIK